MERRLGPFSRTVTPPCRAGEGHGGPTPNMIRGPRWRRSSRGLFVPADVAVTPEQRIAEAAACLPDFGGVTGWGALRWMGGTWFDGRDDVGRATSAVTLATGYADVRNQPGIVVSQERLGPVDLIVHDGLRLTSAPRSLCFEMRYAKSLVEAVRAADMAAYSDLLSLDEAADYIFPHTGITGIDQARKGLALASESSWSPMETRLRMVWVLEAGLPTPLVNRPLFDLTGRHLATPDLLDEQGGLVIEYDGALHLDRRRRTTDLRRERVLRDVGLAYLTVVADDFRDPRALALRLQREFHTARSDRRRPRMWTTSAPAWWRPTNTVAQRRALATAVARRRPEVAELG